MLLLPLAVAVIAAWLAWGRPARPLASATPSGHWLRWLLAGALAIALAVGIPAIDGGELNQFWWTVAALALLGGIAMIVTAVVVASNDRTRRLASH